VLIATLLPWPLVAGAGYDQLHAFGFPDGMGELPQAAPMKGSDGFWYGTASGGGKFYGGVLYRLNNDGTGYQVIHHFGAIAGDATSPYQGVVEASDHVLYGATYWGGNSDRGTVYKINRDGTGYQILHHFGQGSDGQNPNGRLIEVQDGTLYGVTLRGGTFGVGTIYRLRKDGVGYQVFRSFGNITADGQYPLDRLVQGTDRLLYGVTGDGGPALAGTVYRVATNNTGYTILHNFSTTTTDGFAPYAGLIEGADKAFYGTTRQGGAEGRGTVFRLTANGSSFTVLHSFSVLNNDGAFNPEGGLFQSTDGVLFGTTGEGGSSNSGTIFRVNTNGTSYTVLHSFAPETYDGRTAESPFIELSNGVLMGVTRMGGKSDRGTLYKVNKDGSNYAELRSFTLNGGDGQYGFAHPIEGTDGFLYGTCVNGGWYDCGVVYKMAKDGANYTILHQFGRFATDGCSTWGNVIEGSDHALYGTARHGGTFDAGILFRLNRDGTGFAIVRSFTTNLTEGSVPMNSVIQGSDGRLYGRTLSGGATDGNTIFGVNKDGSNYRVLHSFGLKLGDNLFPYAPLLEGSDGAIYGTTEGDGAFGSGSVFKINKDGSGFVSLHDFAASGTDDLAPEGGVMEASNGRLYGAGQGGGSFEWGALFSLNKDGSDYRMLHSFNAVGTEGYLPIARPVEGPGGVLFGGTYYGGNSDSGTIYQIGKDGGDFSFFYRFIDDATDGWYSYSEMIRASDGALYGSAFGGGLYGSGTIFRIKPVGLTARRSANAVNVTVSGFVGQRYGIETVRTLTSTWTEVARVTNVTGSVDYIDTNISSNRFYRARLIVP